MHPQEYVSEKMTHSRRCLVVCLGLTLACAPFAKSEESTRRLLPLGIALEEYSYPFPVSYLPIRLGDELVRMAYMTHFPTRPGTGRIVVLLHGDRFYGSYWESTARALANSGHLVIIPDQIGFGKSGKPDWPANFDQLADNTARLLDSIGIGKVAVVGHSMGGMLAIRFARKYSERVTHLILENPLGLEDYREHVPPQSIEELFEHELALTSPDKIRQVYQQLFASWKPEYEHFVEVRTRVTLSGEYPRWAMAAALARKMIFEQPVQQEFGLLRVPTLLIIGQEDRTAIGVENADPIVRRKLGRYSELGKAAVMQIRESKLVEFPNVAHVPHLEAPDLFQKYVREFLKLE